VWDVTRRASPRGRRSVGRWRLAGRARPSEVRLVVGSLATLERARSAAPRRSPIGAPSMSVDEKGTQADGVVKDKRCYASQVSLCSHRSAATSSSPSSSDPASLRIRVVSLDRSPVGSDGGAAARAPAGSPSNADSEVDDGGRDPARCQGQALECASIRRQQARAAATPLGGRQARLPSRRLASDPKSSIITRQRVDRGPHLASARVVDAAALACA
jgi:hypothetical protein